MKICTVDNGSRSEETLVSVVDALESRVQVS